MQQASSKHITVHTVCFLISQSQLELEETCWNIQSETP